VIQASWEASRQTQNIPTRLQPEHEPLRMAVSQVQQNHAPMAETRLPSYFSENQPVSGQETSGVVTNNMHFNQQPYQSSRSLQPPLPRDNNSQLILEWRIR